MMAQKGWLGIPFPKEYGGMGLDALSYAIAVEELSRTDGGFGVILSAHVSLGSWPIYAFGSEEQKQKYLVPCAKGEKLAAFGLTEPNAGSDAGGTETTVGRRSLSVKRRENIYYQWWGGGYLRCLCSDDTGYRNQRNQCLYRRKGLEGL